MTMTLPAYPSIIGIETINTCNARCPFCPLFQGDDQLSRETRPAKIMDMALFEKIIGEVAQWGQYIPYILLNMNGEPLQDPLIGDRLKIVQRAGIGHRIEFATNGHFLNEKRASEILSAGIGKVTLGFDGATKETYERHRVRCGYDRVLANITEFVRLRKTMNGSTRVAIQYVRTTENSHEANQAFEMFSRILDPEMDLFQDDFSKDWSNSQGPDSYYLMPRLSQPHEKPRCSTIELQLIVNSDGKIQACCWDYNLTVSGGVENALHNQLLGIWRSKHRELLVKRVNALDPEQRPEKCRLCCFSVPVDDLPIPAPMLPGEYLLQPSPYGYTYRFPPASEGPSHEKLVSATL